MSFINSSLASSKEYLVQFHLSVNAEPSASNNPCRKAFLMSIGARNTHSGIRFVWQLPTKPIRSRMVDNIIEPTKDALFSFMVLIDCVCLIFLPEYFDNIFS